MPLELQSNILFIYFIRWTCTKVKQLKTHHTKMFTTLRENKRLHEIGSKLHIVLPQVVLQK